MEEIRSGFEPTNNRDRAATADGERFQPVF